MCLQIRTSIEISHGRTETIYHYLCGSTGFGVFGQQIRKLKKKYIVPTIPYQSEKPYRKDLEHTG